MIGGKDIFIAMAGGAWGLDRRRPDHSFVLAQSRV